MIWRSATPAPPTCSPNSSPPGCAVMTGCGAVVHSAQVCPGDSVAVIGAGGVGLCVLQAAYNLGAYPIIVVDLTDEKIAFAKTFGASRSGDTVPPCPLHRSVTGQHHEPRMSAPRPSPPASRRLLVNAASQSHPQASSGSPPGPPAIRPPRVAGRRASCAPPWSRVSSR